MNLTNASLNTAAAALVTLGITTLQSGGVIWAGLVEVFLGLLAFYIYEKTPSPK